MRLTCNLKRGKITGMLIVKVASRYMVKKYGQDAADKIMIERAIKKPIKL